MPVNTPVLELRKARELAVPRAANQLKPTNRARQLQIVGTGAILGPVPTIQLGRLRIVGFGLLLSGGCRGHSGTVARATPISQECDGIDTESRARRRSESAASETQVQRGLTGTFMLGIGGATRWQ